MFKWHETYLLKMMDKLNLSVYQVAWISFIKGLILGAVFYHFFFQ